MLSKHLLKEWREPPGKWLEPSPQRQVVAWTRKRSKRPANKQGLCEGDGGEAERRGLAGAGEPGKGASGRWPRYGLELRGQVDARRDAVTTRPGTCPEVHSSSCFEENEPQTGGVPWRGHRVRDSGGLVALPSEEAVMWGSPRQKEWLVRGTYHTQAPDGKPGGAGDLSQVELLTLPV